MWNNWENTLWTGIWKHGLHRLGTSWQKLWETHAWTYQKIFGTSPRFGHTHWEHELHWTLWMGDDSLLAIWLFHAGPRPHFCQSVKATHLLIAEMIGDCFQAKVYKWVSHTHTHTWKKNMILLWFPWLIYSRFLVEVEQNSTWSHSLPPPPQQQTITIW